VRKISSVKFLEEVNQLSNKVGELERKLCELESSNNNQVSLKRNIEENLIKTQSEKIGLQELMKLGKQALDEKNSQISRLNDQIEQITNKKDEKERELTLSQEEIRKITELFNNLQTANKEKDQEILKQAKKIKELKESLGKSQEEILSRKIDYKEEKLEIFLQQFRISLEQIRSLLSVYEDLINARQNFNHTNIRTAENNIDKIKREVLNGEISIENKRKICRKCEKLINLKLELEKVYQQQFEAKQEIPTSL
jgi:chromosome segregation ATPase